MMILTGFSLCIATELQQDVVLRINDIEHELLAEDDDTSALADEEDDHTSTTLELREEPPTTTAVEADKKGQTKA